MKNDIYNDDVIRERKEIKKFATKLDNDDEVSNKWIYGVATFLLWLADRRVNEIALRVYMGVSGFKAKTKLWRKSQATINHNKEIRQINFKTCAMCVCMFAHFMRVNFLLPLNRGKIH